MSAPDHVSFPSPFGARTMPNADCEMRNAKCNCKMRERNGMPQEFQQQQGIQAYMHRKQLVSRK